MKVNKFLLLVLFLALIMASTVAAYTTCTATTCTDCECMISCNSNFPLSRPQGACGGPGICGGDLCCCTRCTVNGQLGCEITEDGCCDPAYECSLNHCCPAGDIWNTTTLSCQAPILPDTCYELGGDTYCANNFAPKTQCCGGPNSGHCEVCCSPEGTYKDCPTCEYCNTTAGVNNWKCSNQLYGLDMKNDCPVNKACSGTGTCVCIDHTPVKTCIMPTEPIIEDCVQYTLSYICEHVSCTNCPNGCITFPGTNPFSTYVSCCTMGGVPECVEACVLEEGGPAPGGCNDFVSTMYPDGCCDPSNICTSNHCCPTGATWNFATQRCLSTCADYEESCAAIPCCSGFSCTNSHCCAAGETWDASSGRCEPTCTVPKLPASTTNYLCLDDSHLISEGTPTNSGACGVGCYNFWIGLTKYSQACGVTEQCIRYNFPIPQDVGEDKKICYLCKENKAACCFSGMVARTDADCKTCNPDWYLEEGGCHCCPKDYEWDGVTCRAHAPCYSASSNLGFCNYRAPDCSYNPEEEWLYTPFNPLCVNPNTMFACCFVDAGLYGWIIGEEFYLWHEIETITPY